jgi:hypothetical protein
MPEVTRPRIVDGGWLPFSPISIIKSRSSFDPRSGNRRIPADRTLQDNAEAATYLVDKDGNEYETYSLAWRYIGMYLDCDIDQEDNGDRRNLDSGGNCDRVLLWAAVSKNTTSLVSSAKRRFL